jgi:hypothetical protein
MQKGWTGVGRQFGKILKAVAVPYLLFHLHVCRDKVGLYVALRLVSFWELEPESFYGMKL